MCNQCIFATLCTGPIQKCVCGGGGGGGGGKGLERNFGAHTL